jgi:tetratricopeptide (TPR) repeat protein
MAANFNSLLKARENVEFSLDIFCNVAIAFAKSGDSKLALDTIKRIRDPSIRDSSLLVATLQAIALSLAEHGGAKPLLATILSIKHPGTKTDALIGVAEIFIKAEKITLAKELLANAAQFTNRIGDEDEVSAECVRLAKLYAQLGEYKTARELADKVKRSEEKLQTYVSILVQYSLDQNPNLREAVSRLGLQ